jgi:sporulation protein YlmC with PRC-barrel domain
MILSEVLGLAVHDSGGRVLGRVNDLRFVLDGSPGELLADARLYGIIVSPHSRASYLGYERTGVSRPAAIGRFLAWRHRGSFLVEWTDVAILRRDGVHLKPGHTERDPALPR